MPAPTELTINPAKDWHQLQDCKEWFLEDFEQLQRQHHRRFLEQLMGYERQQFLNAAPYQRRAERTDQANGFYHRHLSTRLGVLRLAVSRTRSGLFRPQVLARSSCASRRGGGAVWGVEGALAARGPGGCGLRGTGPQRVAGPEGFRGWPSTMGRRRTGRCCAAPM